MQDLAIVRTLLSSEPELERQPGYSPPTHIAKAADKFYRSVVMPPREHFYDDESWLYQHWTWTKAVRADGQMFIYCDGHSIPVHRFIWMMLYGELPEGMFARPACGKDDCVSIHHIRLRPRKTPGHLTERDYHNIRSLFTSGDSPCSARTLAGIFKVSEQRIYQILGGKDD